MIARTNKINTYNLRNCSYFYLKNINIYKSFKCNSSKRYIVSTKMKTDNYNGIENPNITMQVLYTYIYIYIYL